MRVQPYSVGSIVHVIKRGARGMRIVRDDRDKWRFVKSLYLLNDTYQDENWHRDTVDLTLFERPQHWPKREPLTAVLAWTLLPNHFHLLLSEIKEGGVAKFMQRLGGSMTLYHNQKYTEQGSIFQGSYKSRTVNRDEYLRYVFSYITVKNVFELYPGGLVASTRQFNKAWEWALQYPFASMGAIAKDAVHPIISQALLESLNLPGDDYKQASRDMVTGYVLKNRPDFAPLMLEKW